MTASPTVAGDNSALELLQTINATAKFNDWLGLKVLSASQSGVEIEILWKEDLGQYAGFLHAGVIAGLIDTVCGFAAAVVVGRVLASHFSVPASWRADASPNPAGARHSARPIYLPSMTREKRRWSQPERPFWYHSRLPHETRRVTGFSRPPSS
jgi:hypothetical protein